MWRSIRIRRANRIADSLRDRRLWRDAVAAYAEVLRLAPGRSDIWIQYGHALKESGDVAKAKDAYEQALALDATPADSWLQLGHALKLLGNNERAISAYSAALERQPSLTAAVNEIVGLSDSSRARLFPGHGFDALQDTLKALASIRETLASIDRLLPPIASLNAFTPDQFGLFRQFFRLPPPPETKISGSCRAIVLVEGNDHTRLERTLRSLRAQVNRPSAITVVVASGLDPQPVEKCDGVDVEYVVGASVGQAVEQLSTRASEDVFLLVVSGAVCDRFCATWLHYVFNKTNAELIIPDEVVAIQGDDLITWELPLFRECPADLNWQEIVSDSSMVGIRRSALRRHMDSGAKPSGNTYGEWLSSLRGALVPCHVPRLLAVTDRRDAAINSFAASLGHDAAPQLLPSEAGQAARQRICLIVPTRNLGDYLKRCFSSARNTVAGDGGLEIVLIDNQSDDAATLEYLEVEAGRGTQVLREDAPFNWSRLSNLGASATKADILVFLNNDIEFIKPGWDETLRHLLSESTIGAVGARLLYPSGHIQHAGIVFRPNALPEHDGRDALASDPGPCNRWTRRRYVCAVTGAFLAVRRADFWDCGGFDEVDLPIWFSDLDLCLKLRSSRRIVYEPSIELVHHESITIKKSFEDEERHKRWQRSADFMRKKWGGHLHFDPSYNPHHAPWGTPFRHIAEPSEQTVLDYIERAASMAPWQVPSK